MTNSTSSICSGCCTHCRWTAALNQFMTRLWRCSQSGPHWLPCWFTCSFPNLINRSGKILVRIQSLPTPPNSVYTLQTTEAVFFVLQIVLQFCSFLFCKCWCLVTSCQGMKKWQNCALICCENITHFMDGYILIFFPHQIKATFHQF